MSSLSSAITSLQVAQRALDVISNNLANQNTPGYHRQVPSLASRPSVQVGGISYGRGVELTDVRQIRSEVLETAFTNQQAVAGKLDAELRLQTRLESRLSVATGTPFARLEEVFNNLEQLSTRLEDPGLRNVLVSQFKGLTDEFHSLSAELRQIQADTDKEIGQNVAQVNSLSQQIASLNSDISRAETVGGRASDLRDARDQLINQLSSIVDVQVNEGNNGTSTVISNGIALVIGANATGFETRLGQNAQAEILVRNTTTTVTVAGGQLAGLLNVRNGDLADAQSRLHDLARNIIRQFDAVHATGVGTAGSFTRLDSVRPVKDITVPLAKAGLAFPPQKGELAVTVKNSATGERLVYRLPPIDPGSLSLQGFADSLAASVPEISSYASAQAGKLTLQAASGFTFDFTGGVDSRPTVVGGGPAATTAAINLDGTYNGTANDTLTFTLGGPSGPGSTGTVGATAGLTLTATNSNGDALGTFNIGRGYVAGTALQLTNGVTVKIGTGTISEGEVFEADAVGTPDSSGILVALGLNSIFSGSDATSIGINPEILADSRRLATSRSGGASDSTNLRQLIGLRDKSVFEESEETFREFSSSLIATIGQHVQESTVQKETSDTLVERLTVEREGLSGVDPNEELVNMLRFQRQFEIAARFISTVNQTLDELLRIVG